MAIEQSPTPVLWQLSKTKPKKPAAPTPTPAPFTLTQGNTAIMKSQGIPKNGSVSLNFPGCTTVTFYQAFDSKAAQEVWTANKSSPYVFSKAPENPKTSGLMVTADASGNVETMIYFIQNATFELANNKITGGSNYSLTCQVPGYPNPWNYMNLNSPDISVDIPHSVFGGLVNSPTPAATNTNKSQARPKI